MSLKRKKRVLAIDDEPAMTEWLKILLEHAGYEVRTALIGTRGEELFKTNSALASRPSGLAAFGALVGLPSESSSVAMAM